MSTAGLALLVLALVDVFTSLVRTPMRSGPFTYAAEFVVCRSLLWAFERTGWRGLLGAIGPLIIAARAFAVVAVLVFAWFLLFSAGDGLIVASKDGTPATSLQRLYFVGYSISTLGLGDFVPATATARMMTVFTSLTGFMVLTFVVGSISPLSDVIASKNSIAFAVHSAGRLDDGPRGFGSEDRGIDRLLDTVLSDLVGLAHSIGTLPVVHRMHAEREQYALSVALVRIHDALRPVGERTTSERIAANAMDEILHHLGTSWLGTGRMPDEGGRDAWRRRSLAAFLRKDRLSA